MRTYYKEFFLEDIYHFEALDVWKELKEMPRVELFYDKDDADYRKNIKVKLADNDSYSAILGVLSEDDSKSMLSFFKAGWNNVFSGQICFLEDKGEKQRIKIVVYINDVKKELIKNTSDTMEITITIKTPY